MSVVASMATELCPPSSKFAVDDIPNLSGKVMIVTGGYSGIGKETVKALLSHNAKVYIAARSKEKAEVAIKDLRDMTGKEAIFLNLDLANLKAVKVAAEEFLSKETELHVLFNNGGVMMPPIEATTVDGYDLQFGTNVIGHFYFTKLLLSILVSTAKTSDAKARVVNTSSNGHLFGKLDFTTLADGRPRKKASPTTLYCQSKYGNVVFSAELARRYGAEGIISTSLSPGLLKTDLQRNITGMGKVIVNAFLREASYGALTQLWAGTSPEGLDFNGKYLIPWAREGKVRADSQDPETGKKLWKWLEEQVQNV